MAIKLPDFSSLGFNDPQSSGRLPQYPQEDAGAAGLAVLGKGLQSAGGAAVDYAADQVRRQNKVASTLAEANFATKLYGIQEQLKNEGDPAKIDALRAQIQTEIDTSGAAITDPDTRALWGAKRKLDASKVEGLAQQRQLSIWHDRNLAGSRELIDAQLKIATEATDPADREAAQRRIGEIVGSLEQAGTLSATDRQKAVSAIGDKITKSHNEFADRDWVTQNTGGRSGGGGGRGGWGSHAPVAVGALSSQGLSPAAVQGIMANGLGEGGFNDAWVQSGVQGAGGREQSYGHWQFNVKGELPAYEAWVKGKGDPKDTRLQAQFVAKRMEELHPGFSKITDPKEATDLVAIKFERYQGAAPGQRHGLLAEAQRAMGRGGDAGGGGDDTPKPRTYRTIAEARKAHPGQEIHEAPGGGFINEEDFPYPEKFLTGEPEKKGKTPGGEDQPAAGAQRTDWQALIERVNNDSSLTPDRRDARLREIDRRRSQQAVGWADNGAALTLAARRGEKTAADVKAAYDADLISPEKYVQLTTELEDKIGVKDDIAREVGGYDKGFTGPRRAKAAPVTPVAPPEGLVEPGNIDLNNRPAARTTDVQGRRSVSVGTDQGAVLIPTVSDDGKIISDDEAKQQYARTGKHLGVFKDTAAADAYAKQLSASQGAQYGAPATAAPADITPHFDLAGSMRRLQDRADRGERTQEQANAAQAGVQAWYNRTQAAEANQRAALTKRLSNTAAMLADGREADYDQAEIKHFFPQEKADEMLQILADSKEDGQILAGVRTASRADLMAQREQMQLGLNEPNAPNYEARRRRADSFDKAIVAREKVLKEDPAGYVAQYSSIAAEKYAAIEAVPPEGRTAAFADYAATALAEQERLGVPSHERSILPANIAAKKAAQIAALDPSKPEQEPVRYLNNLAKVYGAGTANDYWPQAFGDIVKHGKLPGEYQIVAMMNRPDQAVAAADLSRSLALMREKGGAATMRKSLGEETAKNIDRALIPALEQFRLSTGPQDAGEKLYENVRDSAQALAGYYVFRGKEASTAATDAVNAIIHAKYDFGEIGPNTVRVPKGTLSTVYRAAEVVQEGVTVDHLPPIRGNELLTPAQRKVAWLDAVKNGTWANNEDDSGIVLMGNFRNGYQTPITRADGSRVELKFDAAPAISAAAISAIVPTMELMEPGAAPRRGRAPVPTGTTPQGASP